MPDISKCLDKTCPSRTTCYRYRAISSGRQSFAGFVHDPKTGKCDLHWDVTGYNNTQLLTVADADNIAERFFK